MLDTSAARGLGYVPAGTYATTVVEELDWLSSCARRDDAFTASLARHPSLARFLDYAAEDRYLAARDTAARRSSGRRPR